MANKKHLELLNSGVTKWNRWRRGNKGLINLRKADLKGADLIGANLRGADLGGANLRGADLRKVDLIGTNLHEADLSEACLRGADLHEADLSKADLIGANFRKTDLSEACLGGADLRKADLIGTNLREADLSKADLCGADLIGADLRKADLSGADLSEACLGGADLSKADLCGADLSKADLCKADLGGADLSKADLSEANLNKADLTEADLIGANFGGADLSEADFKEVSLLVTVLGNCDLSNAKNLNTCIHWGPSIIDFHTLSKSGNLPLEFLRGCGLSDNYIKYLPSLLGQAIQFYSCFISYSNIDQKFADRIYADLQNKGIRCWFAPHDLEPGKKIIDQIDKAIKIYDRLLLILSDHSMNSNWVKTEIDRAIIKEKIEKRDVLFPISLVEYDKIKNWDYFNSDEGEDFAKKIREYYIPVFHNWENDYTKYQTNFGKLFKGFKIKSAKV